MRKIKPLKIYKMNYFEGLFKPMLSNKLGVTKLFKITFKADVRNDLLELDGIGIPKGDIAVRSVKCNPMTIKENMEYKGIMDKNISKNVTDCDTWVLAYVVIDFVDRFICTEVYYISKSGAKNFQKFKNPW